MSDAPHLAGYHHLGITVRDIDASEAWYTKTLGLVRAFVEKHYNDTGYAVVLTRPGTSFFLGLDHHHEADRKMFDPARTGLDHFALAVSGGEDVHAWAAHSTPWVSSTSRSRKRTTRCRWRWSCYATLTAL